MCGIILTNSKKLLTTQLYAQQQRGLRGAGYITKNTTDKTDNIFDLLTNLPAINKNNPIAFHHRIPTSTFNTIETAHPFSLPGDQDFQGIHNGIIYNPLDVLPFLIQKSDWFVGNDSQAIIYELLTALKQNKTKIQRKSQGYASCVLRDNKGFFYIYKDQNQPDFFYTAVEGCWIISSLKYNQNSKTIPSNLIIRVSNDGTLTKVCRVIMPKIKPIKFDYEATSGIKSNFLDFYNGKYSLISSSPKFTYTDF
jgi:glutamine phosphoribosylpyrophosphate amidotransferase